MSWNRIKVKWGALKGKSERQAGKLKNYDSDLAIINQLKHESESLESIKIIKTRAENQLSELQDMLRNVKVKY